MGNKDGYTGNWLFALVRQAAAEHDRASCRTRCSARRSSRDPKYSGFYTALAELKHRRLLQQRHLLARPQPGLAAASRARRPRCPGRPTATRSPGPRRSARQKIGVGHTPKLGHGQLADTYDTTQSSTAFITSWSQAQAGRGRVPRLAARRARSSRRGTRPPASSPPTSASRCSHHHEPDRPPAVHAGQAAVDLAGELPAAAGRPERRPARGPDDHVRLGHAGQGGDLWDAGHPAVEDPAPGRVPALPAVGRAGSRAVR